MRDFNINFIKVVDITFQLGDGEVMVNATQMAKNFNKRPIDWLRLPSTDMFINELEAVRKSHRSDLLATENGIGTWMHEDVALDFVNLYKRTAQICALLYLPKLLPFQKRRIGKFLPVLPLNH